jgi:hypothetical protein
MVGLHRGVQRVLGVAKVDAVEVAREFAFDDGEVVGVPLACLWPPRPGAVGVVVVLRQRGQKLADDFYVHHLLDLPS